MQLGELEKQVLQYLWNAAVADKSKPTPASTAENR